MNAARFAAIVLLCFSIPGHSQVRLKPAAILSERHFVLADVADIEGPDAAALRAVRLGRSPRVGQAEQLTLPEARRLARTQLGETAERVSWQGARSVRIETAARPYDGAGLLEAAAAHAAVTLAARYERVEVRPAGAPPALLLPPGAVTLRARDAGLGERPRSRMPVWVDVLIDGEFYRTVLVPLQIEARGERRAQLAVNRGDQVTLRVARGAIAIESAALALSSGGVGQTVKVRPAASDAVLSAQVLSERVVQLAR